MRFPRATRLVRSLKEECLDRIIPLSEGHLRRAVTEFVAYYHRERNHQGLDNGLIDGARGPVLVGCAVNRDLAGCSTSTREPRNTAPITSAP